MWSGTSARGEDFLDLRGDVPNPWKNPRVRVAQIASGTAREMTWRWILENQLCFGLLRPTGA